MSKNTKNTAAVALARAEGSIGIASIDLLKQELANLTIIAETPYKTSGSLEAFGQTFNIREETSVSNLELIVASALSQEDAVLRARAALEITEAKAFKFGGHLVADIITDCLLRKRIIKTDDRRKKLEVLMEKAKTFITVQDQEKMFMQELETVLTSV